MKKNTVIAVVVFAALAIAAFAALREKPERGITRMSFASVKPDQVTGIRITGENPIELGKKDGKWTAEGKPADAATVQRLLEGVAKIHSSELVTRNSTRFEALQVAGDKATRVALLDGESILASFAVGSASGGATNVRVGDAVYAVRGIYRGIFSHDRTAWLDRTLFHDKIDDARKIEVKLAQTAPYSLVRDGEQWRLEDPATLPDGQRFDHRAARSLVSALVNARAADVLDKDPGPEVSGLGDGTDSFTLYVGGGKSEAATRSLRLGAADDHGAVYARASTREEIVTLPSYVARNLRKKLADLRDLTLMKFDAAQAKRLELVRGDRHLAFEHTESGWQIVESSEKASHDFDFDSSLVRVRLGRIAAARADTEATGADLKTTGLDKPTARAVVTLDDGSVGGLEFGTETTRDDRKFVFARGNADNRLYLAPVQLRDAILGGLKTFAKREQPPGLANLDPKALAKLPPEIRQSVLRKLAEQQERQKLIERVKDRQGTKKK